MLKVNAVCAAALPLLAALLVSVFCAKCGRDKWAGKSLVIVAPQDASFAEALAAKEIRRYFYLRTGKLIPVVRGLGAGRLRGGLIVVGGRDRPVVKALLDRQELESSEERLAAGQYRLKTITVDECPVLVVAGGDSIGTLYGAYRLAEYLGVRFYLHGDVVPDEQAAPTVPELDETGRPLFALRGILPFHDFPEGPDWWDLDTYKAVLAQLPKLRMNFFGLHTYPEGDVGPEPTVWIGGPRDLGPGGRVVSSYSSSHFTTLSGTWGYKPRKTGEYSFGAGRLFERDCYGAAYMDGMAPRPGTAGDCNRMFDRMGAVLDDALSFARRLGINTCIGTETPLTIPSQVRERLEARGLDPDKPAVIEKIYQGMFQRIIETHPLDYYWLWTPESWTWEGADEGRVKATLADIRAAVFAAKKVEAPFTLATCGWVLGPSGDRSLFGRVLPEDMPVSCINRGFGKEPVEPGFAGIGGRPKWAVPWLEDDPALTVPQLWAGRMRRDAADALSYGCTGLMGIHWRTRILGPNVSALAHAAWDQGDWGRELEKEAGPDDSARPRRLRVDDFYLDWARCQFGPQVAEPVARVFSELDCRLPCPADWVRGPGGIKPDSLGWDKRSREYRFVDSLAALRPQVSGAGNLERFDYWLNSFRYLRAVARVSCEWGKFDKAVDRVMAVKDPGSRRRLAWGIVMPVRKELVALLAEVHRLLLSTVSTTGGMGTVANWQQHVLPMLLDETGEKLSEMIGTGKFPGDAMPQTGCDGPPRLFVPYARTCLVKGEKLELKVIILGAAQSPAKLYWRPLGRGRFAAVPLTHLARGVYTVTLPQKATAEDLEYYVQVKTADGAVLRFPATAPKLNQTVVVVPVRGGEG
ncbi:MAG: hypothetical protein U9N45_00445 [Gemmatimonadota bacterium]|nr:hypothetical protein [Gemmatimonadota bacterium]